MTREKPEVLPGLRFPKVAHVTEVEAIDELVAEEMSVANGDVASERFVAGHLLQDV
jgi:hypothetical protein